MMKSYVWITAVVVLSMCVSPTNGQELQQASDAANSKSHTIKVAVDSGARNLSLTQWGEEGPAIVIEGGGGRASSNNGEWDNVAEPLSETYRVYLYDRAGLGDSEPPSKLPRTSADIASDLQQMIKEAGVPTPVVLVGFSLGGMHSLVFAKTYPNLVKGIVLIDSTHPDQDETWYNSLPTESSADSEPLKKARTMLSGRIHDRGEHGERLDMVTSREQNRAVKSLGTIPILVLTHSPKFKVDPRLPEDILNSIENSSQQLQKSFLTLSKDSKQIIAENAGHAIHIDEPDLVISAVKEVMLQSAK